MTDLINPWTLLCISWLTMTENMSHEQHESPEKILFKEVSFLIQGAIFKYIFFPVFRDNQNGSMKLFDLIAPFGANKYNA